jgi:hypothetical protein
MTTRQLELQDGVHRTGTNVLNYLPAGLQTVFKGKLQAAYEKPTYAAAKAALQCVRLELAKINASAAASLSEGFEETLTLHRLGLFAELGRSFKTTNCIENLNALVGQYPDRVDCWRNADQTVGWPRPCWISSRDCARAQAISICRGCGPHCKLSLEAQPIAPRDIWSRSGIQLGMALTPLAAPCLPVSCNNPSFMEPFA